MSKGQQLKPVTEFSQYIFKDLDVQVRCGDPAFLVPSLQHA